VGIHGPILATVITTSVFVLLPVAVFLRRYFDRLPGSAAGVAEGASLVPADRV
jgi:hypothetical protein